jgi:hypothetical protein
MGPSDKCVSGFHRTSPWLLSSGAPLGSGMKLGWWGEFLGGRRRGRGDDGCGGGLVSQAASAGSAPQTRGVAGADTAMRARLREAFSEGTVAVLATASRETGPASTLVSWLTLREDGVVALALALDRRGRAYENARSDPRASLEVFDVSGGLAVRGWLTVTNRFVRAAPFDCALAILDVRRFVITACVRSFSSRRATATAQGSRIYERVEKTIIRELRAAPIFPNDRFPSTPAVDRDHASWAA